MILTSTCRDVDSQMAYAGPLLPTTPNPATLTPTTRITPECPEEPTT